MTCITHKNFFAGVASVPCRFQATLEAKERITTEELNNKSLISFYLAAYLLLTKCFSRDDIGGENKREFIRTARQQPTLKLIIRLASKIRACTSKWEKKRNEELFVLGVTSNTKKKRKNRAKDRTTSKCVELIIYELLPDSLPRCKLSIHPGFIPRDRSSGCR